MKQKKKKQLTHWLSVIVVGIALGLALQFVRAWTEPTAAPPGGNVGAPINTGGQTQVKSGTMGINSNGLNTVGLLVRGRVGIDTLNPTQKLDVAGKLKIGNDAAPETAGTIRWTGTDFEGFDGTTWKSFTATSGGGGAGSGTVEFDSTGTWTCPAGVTGVHVIAIGGGGGSGGYGCCGGAGGIVERDVGTVPGRAYEILVGAPGWYTGGPGAPGQESKFSDEVVAYGGGGGMWWDGFFSFCSNDDGPCTISNGTSWGMGGGCNASGTKGHVTIKWGY